MDVQFRLNIFPPLHHQQFHSRHLQKLARTDGSWMPDFTAQLAILSPDRFSRLGCLRNRSPANLFPA
jgi:hypothetical protein